MQKVSYPTPENNIAPIAPLEFSVITGRSYAAAKRGGFLELQERLVEESVVALFWLWGTKWMENIFDRLQNSLGGRLKHVDTGVENAIYKNASKLELTPMERYASRYGDALGMHAMRSLKTSFGVLTNLAIVALVIPRLNQIKTDWVIRNFYKKKRNPASTTQQAIPNASTRQQTATPQVSRSQQEHLRAQRNVEPSLAGIPPEGVAMPPAPQTYPFHGLPVQANPAWVASNSTMGFPPSSSGPFPNMSSTFSKPGAISLTSPYSANPYQTFILTQPQALTPPIYFGDGKNVTDSKGIPPNGRPGTAQSGKTHRFASSLGPAIQSVSHLLDRFSLTDYGKILSSDVGIVSGRVYMTGKRDVPAADARLEAAEIVFRDGVSLYFYMLCVPHLMGLLGKAAKKLFNASIKLEPLVAQDLKDRLFGSEALRDGQPLTRKKLETLLYGSSNSTLKAHEGTLKQAFSTANRAGFLDLLEAEGKVYLNQSENLDLRLGLRKTVEGFLNSLSGSAEAGHLPAKHAEALVDAIRNRQGAFAALESPADRENLVVAVKQAFRHTVGLPASELRESSAFRMLFQNAPEESQALQYRLRQLGEQDGRDLVNSMFRRVVNLARESSHLGPEHALVKRAENVSRWVEESFIRGAEIWEPELQAEKGTFEDLMNALRRNLNGRDTERNRAKTRDILNQIKRLEPDAPIHANTRATEVMPWLSKRLGERRMAELQAVLTELSHTAQDEPGGLLRDYAQRITSLLSPDNKGYINPERARLFQLSADCGKTAEELLVGGLDKDSVFLKKALGVVGALPKTARGNANPEKVKALEGALKEYLDTFMDTLEKKGVFADNAAVPVKKMEELFGRYLKRNMFTRYGIQLFAMGLAMFGIGIAVPNLQYFITRKLTGKNRHPALAALEAENGIGESAAATSTASASRAPSKKVFNVPSPGLVQEEFAGFRT